MEENSQQGYVDNKKGVRIILLVWRWVICKICSSLDSKGDRKRLHGTATDTSDVYAAVIELFCEMHPNGTGREFHRYLAEPAFMCKSCFNMVRRCLEMKKKLTNQLDTACLADSSTSLYSTFAAEVCHSHRVLFIILQYTNFLKSRYSWVWLRVKIYAILYLISLVWMLKLVVPNQ